jgi:molybdopterin synthase catalytic subunit
MCRYDVKVTAEALPAFPPAFSPTEGAVVDFFGVVREAENDAKISGLDYEAFAEMAEAELRRVSEQVAAKYPLASVTVYHRTGFVPVGEPSLFARVTAAHRDEAFAGCRLVVELLKARVPIWKHPSYLQTSAETGENVVTAVEAATGNPVTHSERRRDRGRC